jgi:SOS-response transcriptional repressor LexA
LTYCSLYATFHNAMTNWGLRLKELRERKRLTQEDLASRSHLKLSHISRMEMGSYQSVKQDIAEALAGALEMSVSELTAYLYGGVHVIKENPAEYDPLEVLRQRLEASELVVIPVRGYVSAGKPLPQEQQDIGNIIIPKSELSGVSKVSGLFGLKVSGDSLTGDEIEDGDTVIVEPQQVIKDGKIYIIQLGNEFVARHLHLENGNVILTSSHGKYARMKLEELEIKGRIVLSGNWKKH